MKVLESLIFDPAQCRKEVGQLRQWLSRHPHLEEKKHILPFFRKRRHLCAFIASYGFNVSRFDRIAFEYSLFGDFSCDLVVGDSVRHSYCFIEFEDAGSNSLFVKQGRKATREWSQRFDHGCSQIIDWFYKLDDMKKSDEFVARFGARSIQCTGVLVVGRDQYLLAGERERLEWRRKHLVVASQSIQCLTFDMLLDHLEARLATFPLPAGAGNRENAPQSRRGHVGMALKQKASHRPAWLAAAVENGFKNNTDVERIMSVLQSLLQGIVVQPLDAAGWLVLADWLEEHDDPRRAELLRLHRCLVATCCEPDKHPQRSSWQARIIDLLGEGVRPCVPQTTVVLGKGVEMTFSFIPPGAFLMGSVPGEEGRSSNEIRRCVTLTRSFWMAVHPVTQEQWKAVVGTDPSGLQGSQRPVEQVLWDDAVELCRHLREKTGKQFRLPTEAEWEYAGRAGTTTAYSTGDGADAMRRAGWCHYDGYRVTGQGPLPGHIGFLEDKETKPVGQFEPNAWGLYDMHGNVWEWCSDWYERYGPEGARIDPTGPDSGRQRVLRGGCFCMDVSRCRSASRIGFEPDWMSFNRVGCRICLCSGAGL